MYSKKLFCVSCVGKNKYRTITNQGTPEGYHRGSSTLSVCRIKHKESPKFSSVSFTFPYQTGFTLIELLIVVLIIGILATVALPQYQAAVDKAKAAQLMPLVNSVLKAQETYYLANGYYAASLEDLDIDVTKQCSLTGEKKHILLCPTFTLDNSNQYNKSIGSLYLGYCPDVEKNYDTWSKCAEKQIFNVRFYYQNLVEGYTTTQTAGTRACSAATTRGKHLVNLFCPN